MDRDIKAMLRVFVGDWVLARRGEKWEIGMILHSGTGDKRRQERTQRGIGEGECLKETVEAGRQDERRRALSRVRL